MRKWLLKWPKGEDDRQNRQRVQRPSQPDPVVAKPSDGAVARALFQSPATTEKGQGGAGGGTIPTDRPAQDEAGVA